MGSSTLASVYLLAYNGALVLGWSCVLYLACESIATQGPASTFDATHPVLSIAQSAAVLEVLHAFFGLVRSPWLVTAVQVFSRVGVLWGVLWLVPELRSQQLVLGRLPLPGGGSVEPALGVASMVLAWSVTEIIRYAFYFCKECGYVPAPLLWARYSGFLLLYPTGVASELAVVYLALPSLKARGFYHLPMPNAINLAFDATDLFRLALLGYVFGFPMLFGYMLQQRRRQLGGGLPARPKAKNA